MSLAALRTLLKQECSHETCRRILQETSRLFREDLPNRWYFLLLNRVFAEILANPDLYDAETSIPVLEVVSQQALNGIDAMERLDDDLLIASANQMTEAFCAMR